MVALLTSKVTSGYADQVLKNPFDSFLILLACTENSRSEFVYRARRRGFEQGSNCSRKVHRAGNCASTYVDGRKTENFSSNLLFRGGEVRLLSWKDEFELVRPVHSERV